MQLNNPVCRLLQDVWISRPVEFPFCEYAQAVLWALLQRLGVEHPYHSLCQLLALARGNLGKSGKPVSQGSDAAHHVDIAKVVAACTLLQRIAQRPDRQACLCAALLASRAQMQAVTK